MNQRQPFEPQQLKNRLFEATLGIWRVCDRFPHEDAPLAVRLRERAVEVLNDAVLYFSVRDRAGSLKAQLFDELVSKVQVLRAFIEFARLRHHVHEMNFLMLDWEYEQLLTMLDEDGKSGSVPHGPLVTDIFSNNLGHLAHEQKSKPENGADSPSDEPQSQQDFVEQLTDRQKHLYEFFLQSKTAAMRDLIKSFPDVSDRTLRTDLAQLLDLKLIRRVGHPPRHYYRLSTPVEQTAGSR